MHEVLVSKIFNYNSAPTKNVEGQFWFNPSTNVLSRFNGAIWKPITVSSDDVAVLTDGNKISLTNYLNTQIAALVEGIDSKQDKLSYYSENTTNAVSKLSSKRLEVNCYNENGTTYNPLILNNRQGIAVGGNNPSVTNLYTYLDIGDSNGSTLMLSTPAGYSELDYSSITIKDHNSKSQFGFNEETYNILTQRAAGLYYLKDTDEKSTGVHIDTDKIALIDYNKYYSGTSTDEHNYYESVSITEGTINLQKRTNGSSEFIDKGTISADVIKLQNGKFGSAYDHTSDIIITSSRNSSDAPNFHGIAYKCSDSTDTQWFIGRTVDGDNPVDGQPTVSKPYIKGFANAEFSEKVQATTIQAGKEVSSSSGVATLTEGSLNFNTPVGFADFKFDGIEISNANFIVKGYIDKPYVQIPDGNKSSFKIWKGTETEFKALTAVSSDTVYLRVQENNRIKATVGTDTASLENITDSYTLSSTSLTSFITDTKYNNAQGSILITPSLNNSGALIFGEGITDISKGFPLYPDNIVSIPFKDITNFKVAGSVNDSFNYIISFDI